MPKLSVRIRIVLYLLTLICGVGAVLAAMEVFSNLPEAAVYVIYSGSGVLLALAVYYFCMDCRCVKCCFLKWVKKNPLLKRMIEEYRYRTIFSAGISFLLNMLFALYNGAVGILNQSVWFGSMSVYYAMLTCMRFLIVRYEFIGSGKHAFELVKKKEAGICSICGILLLIMTLALGVVVILNANKIGVKVYSGHLIFAVAAYTFYKITISVVNMIKVSKMNSLLLTAARNIGYADALVSVMSLQSAMFTSFDKPGNVMTGRMNMITGTAVCLMIIIMGIYMISLGNRPSREKSVK